MFSSSSSSWILHWSTYDSSSHKRDENEDDEHGDKDNEDEDDDPKMPEKMMIFLDPLELTPFCSLFLPMKTGEKEKKGEEEDDKKE